MKTTVLRRVEASELKVLRDTKLASELENKHKRDDECRDPGEDAEASDELGGNLDATSTVALLTVSSSDEVGVSKASDSEETPEACSAVNGDSIDGVINANDLHDLRGAHVHKSTNHTRDDGESRSKGRASSGNGDKTSKAAVKDVREIEVTLSEASNDKASEGSSSRGKGGGDGNVSSEVSVEDESGTTVETVPAEPESEGTEGAESEVVGLELSSISGPAAEAGSDEECGPEGGNSTGHVHNTGAGKVEHAAAALGREDGANTIVLKGTDPATSGPDPMYNDGVDKDSEPDSNAKVSGQSHAASDGS